MSADRIMVDRAEYDAGVAAREALARQSPQVVETTAQEFVALEVARRQIAAQREAEDAANPRPPHVAEAVWHDWRTANPGRVPNWSDAALLAERSKRQAATSAPGLASPFARTGNGN